MSTEIFDDLEVEYTCLGDVLSGLSDDAWLSPSTAPGWSVADVVLHLAQTDEMAASAVRGEPTDFHLFHGNVDAQVDALVRAERTTPAQTLQRWYTASRAALTALRAADPSRAFRWVSTSFKSRTMATTRLAEHWAHALDITVPLGIDYPDTARLRHIAWLGHSTLPYAFGLAGEAAQPVYCELTAPDGSIWRYGPPDAESSIAGTASAFCRVGAQRLAPDDSGLVAVGPHAEAALRVLRNYAQ